MALIKCPECGGIVSDKAPSCPHCGFPLEASISVQEQIIAEHELPTDKHEAENLCDLNDPDSLNVESNEVIESQCNNSDDPLEQIHRLGSEIDDFHKWVSNNKPPREFRGGVTLGQAALSQMGMIGAVGALLFLRPRYTKLLEKPYYKNMTFDDLFSDICNKTDQMVVLGKKCQSESDNNDPSYFDTSTYITEHCVQYALDWFNFFYKPAADIDITIDNKKLPYALHAFNKVYELVSSMDLTKESLKILKQLT